MKFIVRLIVTCAAVACIIIIFLTTEKPSHHKTNRPDIPLSRIEKCLKLFPHPLYASILIDIPILQAIVDNNCKNIDRPIKIAIEEVVYKNIEAGALGMDFSAATFTYTEFTDYITIHDDTEDFYRIVPRMQFLYFGNFKVPSDIWLFLQYWKRSRYIDCLNMRVNREPVKQQLDPMMAAKYMAGLRDLFLSYDMFLFLNGGTLLGWYRECSVIPHTHDCDMAVNYEGLNLNVIDKFWEENSEFYIYRRLGMPHEGFEMTVYPAIDPDYLIDVFVMYTEKNYSYVGGTALDGTKFRYIYPIYDPYCATDLKGKLFWITCMPEAKLKFEYGDRWHKDFASKEFSWFSSHSNVVEIGKWTEEEMKQAYVVYDESYIDSNDTTTESPTEDYSNPVEKSQNADEYAYAEDGN